MNRFQDSKKALGSDCSITIIVEDSNQEAQAKFKKLWEVIDHFEQRYSRFIETSEINKLNHAAGNFIELDQEFKEILLAVKDFGQRTNGIFNPLVLPKLQDAGYIGSWPHIDSFKSTIDFHQRTEIPETESIEIKGAKARIPASSAIDLGGIGKGYLLDKLSRILDTLAIKNYWISLGGDIKCAGQDIDAQPWIINISHATKDEIISSISNESEKIAIATSGITKRRGLDWHHIIDPRTGKPSTSDILTATVVSRDAISADIYAKCLVIIGSHEAADFLNSKDDVLDWYIQLKARKPIFKNSIEREKK